MNSDKQFQRISFEDFFSRLFEEELSGENKYDPEVAKRIWDHLGQGNIHSRAGKRLAESLIDLAKERSMEKSQ
jgi:hypothetical protein